MKRGFGIMDALLPANPPPVPANVRVVSHDDPPNSPDPFALAKPPRAYNRKWYALNCERERKAALARYYAKKAAKQ